MAHDLQAFIVSRAQWLDVQAVPNEHGGWSVALRLDGFYSDRGDAEATAEHFRAVIEQAFTQEPAWRRLTDWRTADQWWKD